MKDLSKRPLIRAEFELPDGSILTRDWSIQDVEAEGKPFGEGPPAWLERPGRSWPHPQDPITFTGRVKPGHEQEARDLLADRSDLTGTATEQAAGENSQGERSDPSSSPGGAA